MSDERTILDYLEDISNAILDIRSFVQNMSAEAFMAKGRSHRFVYGYGHVLSRLQFQLDLLIGGPFQGGGSESHVP